MIGISMKLIPIETIIVFVWLRCSKLNFAKFADAVRSRASTEKFSGWGQQKKDRK